MGLKIQDPTVLKTSEYQGSGFKVVELPKYEFYSYKEVFIHIMKRKKTISSFETDVLKGVRI